MAFDMMGMEIRSGDLVAYPGRRGSSTYMRVAFVDAVHEYPTEKPWIEATVLTEPQPMDFPRASKVILQRVDRVLRITDICPSLWKGGSFFVDWANDIGRVLPGKEGSV